ncbi:MAG: signal peptidase II [Candidatus Saccharicenans sp.]
MTIKGIKKNYFYFLVIIFWLIIDQVSKYLISRLVGLYQVIPVIRGFFNLTRVHNRGAIFGFLGQASNPLALVLLNLGALFALGIVIYFFIKTPSEMTLTRISLALIIGGALGNLIDRLFRGYVIDFLDFYVGRFHWPFFNLADSGITVGAILLLYTLIRRKEKCIPSS